VLWEFMNQTELSFDTDAEQGNITQSFLKQIGNHVLLRQNVTIELKLKMIQILQDFPTIIYFQYISEEETNRVSFSLDNTEVETWMSPSIDKIFSNGSNYQFCLLHFEWGQRDFGTKDYQLQLEIGGEEVMHTLRFSEKRRQDIPLDARWKKDSVMMTISDPFKI